MQAGRQAGRYMGYAVAIDLLQSGGTKVRVEAPSARCGGYTATENKQNTSDDHRNTVTRPRTTGHDQTLETRSYIYILNPVLNIRA